MVEKMMFVWTRKLHLQLLMCAVLASSWIQMVSSCPEHCECYPSELDVYCENKELLIFPQELEENVEYLSIADNWIKSIPILSKYSQLRMLNASGNHISVLHQDVFRGLRSLNFLDLSSNSIASLLDINADNVFDTNDYLETLILSKNTISAFDEHEHLIISKSLKVLDLSSNRIRSLDKMVLAELPSLTHLHISRNPLQWVIDLKSNSLTYLDVSHGQMDGMNRDQLSGLPSLHTFIVSRNSKFSLYSDVISASLTFYEARYCQLNKPTLQQFKQLEHANLRGNKIEVLRANGFVNNGKLMHLDLSSNAIYLVEQDSFLGLTRIQYLSLAENQISSISWDMFITNHELKILNLSNNPITSLPVNLTLSKLQELDLSHCQIHPVDGFTFTRVPLLSVLDLSQNGIEQIPNNVQSNSLKVLNLSKNRLSSITNDTFSKLPNIEMLNIIGNRFTITPKAYMFDSNSLLRSIQLSDNPWRCECKDQEFKELWEYLTDSLKPPPKLALSERNELKCTSPETLMGKRWEEACSREFWPLINRSTFFDRYGIYILITVMTISFTLVVIVSIRERMKKREKFLRGRLEARRRTVAENHERVVRLYRQSVERIDEEHRRNEQASFQERVERVERHPPTYEEAVLMPRRADAAAADSTSTSTSRDELRQPPLRTRDREADISSGTPGSALLTQANVDPVSHRRDYNEISVESETDSSSDSDELDEENDDDDDDDDDDHVDDGEDRELEEGSRIHPIRIEDRRGSDGGSSEIGRGGQDEAKLMQQLRIEVWSREDIRSSAYRSSLEQ